MGNGRFGLLTTLLKKDAAYGVAVMMLLLGQAIQLMTWFLRVTGEEQCGGSGFSLSAAQKLRILGEKDEEMKTLVAVTNTGEICCLTPLHAIEKTMDDVGVTDLLFYDELACCFVNIYPTAYILDAGEDLMFSGKGPVLLAARFIEPQVEILGEL